MYVDIGLMILTILMPFYFGRWTMRKDLDIGGYCRCNDDCDKHIGL